MKCPVAHLAWKHTQYEHAGRSAHAAYCPIKTLLQNAATGHATQCQIGTESRRYGGAGGRKKHGTCNHDLAEVRSGLRNGAGVGATPVLGAAGFGKDLIVARFGLRPWLFLGYIDWFRRWR